MPEQGSVKYFVIIGVILGAAFLSQQINLLGKGNNYSFINDVTGPASQIMANGTSWAKDNLLPKLGGEAQKRGDMVTQGINEEKEKISENISEKISEKISNYFSGIKDSVIHPGTPQNCPPVPAVASPD